MPRPLPRLPDPLACPGPLACVPGPHARPGPPRLYRRPSRVSRTPWPGVRYGRCAFRAGMVRSVFGRTKPRRCPASRRSAGTTGPGPPVWPEETASRPTAGPDPGRSRTPTGETGLIISEVPRSGPHRRRRWRAYRPRRPGGGGGASKRVPHDFRPPGATWRECMASDRGGFPHLLTSPPPPVWSRPSSERQAAAHPGRPCLVHLFRPTAPTPRTARTPRAEAAQPSLRRTAPPGGPRGPARTRPCTLLPTPTDTAGDRT